MRFSLLLPAMLLLFVNCDSIRSVNENNDANELLVLGDNYIIVLLNDEDVENKGLTMNFDKLTDNVSGNAGCNQYFGSFQQENKNITFSKVAATKMYCKDAEVRKTEEQLLTILPSIKSMNGNKTGNINFYNDQSKLLMSIAYFKLNN
ncbi:MAG: heat shock protein HslJ [Cyclobacteriaceae bacterium]|jgi:heat shock protein HslJ